MTENTIPDDSWIPDGTPLDRPSAARIYDYMLGGYHNFEIDRQLAAKLAAIYPDFALTAHVNRALLRRMLNFVLDQGIDQFLDIGSGIPTAGNVHEIVHRRNPDAHVVYVDIDPTAVAHSQAMLEDETRVAAMRGDVREPDVILNAPAVKRLIDFSRPLCLLLLAVIHFVPDEEQAVRVVERYKAMLAPGSYLLMGVWTYDDAPRDVMAQYEELARQMTTPGRPRSRATVEGYFSGLELVEPGLVHGPLWRPEGPDDLMLDNPGRSVTWVGVGRKP